EPKDSKDFARIINTTHYERLCNMIAHSPVYYGGYSDRENLFIAPTLVVDPKLSDPVMQEEIFGPLLPVIGYKSEQEIALYLNNFEKPLAFYIFSTRKGFVDKMLTAHSFGGGCVNDTVIHFANKRLP